MEHLRHTAAWFPSRVEIAGRRLMPPTLGQWRLLECCDSPFASGGSATRVETALALAILSRPWRAGMRLLRSEWRKALALAPWRLPPPSASRELDAWLWECWWSPDRYVEDGATPSPEAFAPCASRAVRIAARAARENWLAVVPVPCESVWDAPIPHLLLALVAFSENDGTEFEAPGEAESVAASGSQIPGVGGAVVDAAVDPVRQKVEDGADDGDGQDGEQQRVLVDP
jgi:hypothetical protein